MSQRGRKGRSSELVRHSGEIKRFHASMSVRVDKPRSLPAERESMVTVDIEGDLTEPMDGTSQFSIMAYVTPDPVVGQANVPSVGGIVAVKPVLRGVIDLSPDEFQSLLTMAAAGMLRSCSLLITKPRYRRALIVNAYFDTRTPQELDE